MPLLIGVTVGYLLICLQWVTSERFLPTLVTSNGHQLELKVALACRRHLLVAYTNKCGHAIRHMLEGGIVYERASHI